MQPASDPANEREAPTNNLAAGRSIPAPPWPADTVIAFRETHEGRVRSARPLRVIEDTAAGIVGYLDPDSTVAWPRRTDGTPSRTPNLAWSLVIERWQGPGSLWILPADVGWAATLFYDKVTNEPIRCKINFQDPWIRTSCGLDALDLALDLMVELNLTDRFLKDEDELADIVAAGIIPDDRVIRAELDAVSALLDRRAPPFDRTWIDWRPDPSVGPLDLPAGWDRTE